MWVILNDAMLSIVASDCPDLLMVRARVKGDIERVFPKARVSYTPERDYAYRALVPRDVVGAALSARAIGIDYGNFKDSVHEPRRKSIYSRVWETLLDLQGGIGLYARRRRRRGPTTLTDLFDRPAARRPRSAF